MANHRTAWSGQFTRSLIAHCAHETKHHARLLALVVTVSWACCVLSASSSDELRGSVAYPMVPQSGTFGSANSPALWQLPEGPVESLLIIFHPREGNPGNFWDKSPACPICQGIPERRNIVADALARNYAVFVPKAFGGNWEWWPEDNPVVLLVQEMVLEWKNRLGLHGLPTMALGAAYGGFLVSTISLRTGFFDAICLMISNGEFQAINATTDQYPPTIFAYMPRDAKITGNIVISREILDSRGIPTAAVKVYPQPVTPDFFSRTIIGVTRELSAAIFDCIKGEGWLDDANFLNTASYLDIWPGVARKWNIIPDGPAGDLLYMFIKFQMNLAYAEHTCFSGKDNEIFAFFSYWGKKSQNHDHSTISSYSVQADISATS